jgi:hypothetical protein|tara:strand:+ start:242 stop:394 length:153 start_codon:yes stop_codon:yes gene_type:complete
MAEAWIEVGGFVLFPPFWRVSVCAEAWLKHGMRLPVDKRCEVENEVENEA